MIVCPGRQKSGPLRGRRAQVFIFDFFFAAAIFSLVIMGTEALKTEMNKDRLEWEMQYDMRAAADAAMHHIVDIAAVYETGELFAEGNEAVVIPGYALYDRNLALVRPNRLDLERLRGDSLGRFAFFFRRLATTEGDPGYGWLLRFQCGYQGRQIVAACPAEPYDSEITMDNNGCKPITRAKYGSAAVSRIAVSGDCVGLLTLEVWK